MSRVIKPKSAISSIQFGIEADHPIAIYLIGMAVALLVVLLTSCRHETIKSLSATSSIPTQTSLIMPTATPNTTQPSGLLSISSPNENTQVSGGGGLRIALYLVDQDDLPVEGALIQAELWTPDGELYANLSYTEEGNGRYLTENVRLPLRDSAGAWHMDGKAVWNNGKQAEVAGTFDVNPSVSEMYQDLYGFWIDQPQIFGLGTGFYNLSQSGGLHFEDQINEDGSGYVLLDNYRYNAIGITFAALEIHWRNDDFPPNAVSAAAYAQSLVGPGLPHQDPDAPLTELSAKQVSFQDRPAWQVSGFTQEYYVSKAAAEYPVEWLMFTCPGSDELWALVISSDHKPYMNRLRTLQKSFECPTTSQDI